MGLPKIQTPTYFLKLSSGEEIKYRPFLVKEEKILLIGHESDDPKAMINAVKEVIDNCTFNTLDLNTIPMFDLEYIFLQLRAKSKGEVVTLKFNCPECETENGVEVDLSKVEVKRDVTHTNKIDLDGTLGVIMKYPTLTDANNFVTDEEMTASKMFDLLNSSIDYIYDQETTYKPSDYSTDELNDFVDSLPDAAFQRIQEFFSTMPKLREEKNYKCKKCKYKESITLEGLQNFLEFA
jgi:hypothetical protein